MVRFFIGADGWSRTGTALLPADFEFLYGVLVGVISCYFSLVKTL